MRQQAFASPGEALEHFGIKGMRWGFRKEERSSLASNATVLNATSTYGVFGGGGLAQGHPKFELTDPTSLTIDLAKGYADIRPGAGFANAAVERRHTELITTLDEMRKTYPSVAKMDIEVVPMSRDPGSADMVHASLGAVQGIKRGQARIIYNDQLGELTPHQEAFAKKWIPGLGTKNYIAYHEMGHLLSVANGTQRPTYDIVVSGKTHKYGKTNQKDHKQILKRHGLSFKKLRYLSGYAATEPSEALAELSGYYHSPVMRQRLDPATTRKAKALFDEMGGKT